MYFEQIIIEMETIITKMETIIEASLQNLSQQRQVELQRPPNTISNLINKQKIIPSDMVT